MQLSRTFLLLCGAVLCAPILAQTTTLPDFDKGRLWGSPLALLSTGIHGAYILDEPAEFGGIQGARLEINVLDRKARAYVLWRVDKSDASRDESFVEYGLGFANLGELGGRNTALSWFVGGPSAYVVWGNTRRTLEWKRGRGKGTLPMTVMWGLRAEWLSTTPAGAPNREVGLYMPLFARLQLPLD